jgi:hypothetical protein
MEKHWNLYQSAVGGEMLPRSTTAYTKETLSELKQGDPIVPSYPHVAAHYDRMEGLVRGAPERTKLFSFFAPQKQ